MKWLRLYTETRDDPKMKALTDREFRTFIYLLCTVAEYELDGQFPGTSQELSWICRSKPGAILGTLQKLYDLNIAEPCGTGFRFINWKKRQFRTDDVSKRVAGHRAKKKQSETLHETLHVTHQSRAEQIDEFSLIKNNPISQKPTKKKKPFTYSDEFESFWKVYPDNRKTGKGKAFEEWEKARRNGMPTLDEILKAIELQRCGWEWTKEGGQYIPLPSTWIHQRRWDDVPTTGDPLRGKVSEKTARTLENIRAWEEERHAKRDEIQ